MKVRRRDGGHIKSASTKGCALPPSWDTSFLSVHLQWVCALKKRFSASDIGLTCALTLLSRDGAIHWSLKALLKIKSPLNKTATAPNAPDLSNCCLSPCPECLFFITVCFQDLFDICMNEPIVSCSSSLHVVHFVLVQLSRAIVLSNLPFSDVGSCPMVCSS